MSRLVFGIQPVREAIRVHGSAIERVVIEHKPNPKLQGLARFAEGRGVPVESAPRFDLDRAAGAGRHQGVMALAPELVLKNLAQVEVVPTSIFVALDGIMDPQNFGAIVRSSVALGATSIVWPEHASAPLSPAMFRASAGAIEHALLCRVPSLPQAMTDLGERGVTVIGLDAQGPSELGAVDLRGPVAIVTGAEDKGARRTVLRVCHHVARLPMNGPINSLNASVATALALYEILRQRQTPPAPTT